MQYNYSATNPVKIVLGDKKMNYREEGKLHRQTSPTTSIIAKMECKVSVRVLWFKVRLFYKHIALTHKSFDLVTTIKVYCSGTKISSLHGWNI